MWTRVRRVSKLSHPPATLPPPSTLPIPGNWFTFLAYLCRPSCSPDDRPNKTSLICIPMAGAMCGELLVPQKCTLSEWSRKTRLHVGSSLSSQKAFAFNPQLILWNCPTLCSLTKSVTIWKVPIHRISCCKYNSSGLIFFYPCFFSPLPVSPS